MTFKTATDRLMELGVTGREIAEALGLKPNTVRTMRLDPASRSYRKPSEDWRPKLADLAKRRGGDIGELAKELEG